MSLPSVMSHSFSQVPAAEIQRSSFDRSHGYKTTMDAGYLIPFFVDEVLPGDTFNLSVSVFGRLATPLHPVMDNLHLDTQFFFVPNRLMWNNWQKFNGEQEDPDDSTDFVLPVISSGAGGFDPETIFDYMGLVPSIGTYEVNVFPLRAYNLIWNEWYRDQNLQDSVTQNSGDGPDNKGQYELLKRGKRHDYFTSCLPWPQKGPAVDIPLGTTAPIIGLGVIGATDMTSTAVTDSAGNTPTYAKSWNAGADTANVAIEESATVGQPNVFADLTNATAATINSLRQAFQVQRLYERDARGGTRYTEIIRAHFGVVSPDQRLQRPEYLGGGSSAVMINPVAQTSSTDVTSPQGNLAALGTVGATGHGFTKSFTEHGILIGLVSLRADLNYQQGVNRMWSRSTRFDYYWPALAHIGEQAVLNKEIYLQGTSDDDEVFGYQERYAEYRYKPSNITAQMRSSFSTPLDTWHLAQDFSSLPTLSADFIEEDPPVDRIIAVPTEPHLLLDCYFRLKCARPMPMYSVPGLIDHF